MVGLRVGLLVIGPVELELGLKHLALGRREVKLHERDDLARAFAYAQVADRELARVAPVGIVRGIFIMGRHGCEVLN